MPVWFCLCSCFEESGTWGFLVVDWWLTIDIIRIVHLMMSVARIEKDRIRVLFVWVEVYVSVFVYACAYVIVFCCVRYTYMREDVTQVTHITFIYNARVRRKKHTLQTSNTDSFVYIPIFPIGFAVSLVWNGVFLLLYLL